MYVNCGILCLVVAKALICSLLLGELWFSAWLLGDSLQLLGTRERSLCGTGVALLGNSARPPDSGVWSSGNSMLLLWLSCVVAGCLLQLLDTSVRSLW